MIFRTSEGASDSRLLSFLASPQVMPNVRTPCASFRTTALIIQDSLSASTADSLLLSLSQQHSGHLVHLSGQQRLQFRTVCPLQPLSHLFSLCPSSIPDTLYIFPANSAYNSGQCVPIPTVPRLAVSFAKPIPQQVPIPDCHIPSPAPSKTSLTGGNRNFPLLPVVPNQHGSNRTVTYSACDNI